MDYDALRQGLSEAIPYNRHLGLEIEEVGDGRGVVVLPEADGLKNHVGTQHAGGLFSAAEAASGAAFVGAFAEQMEQITALARSARIDYSKIAKGPITATGALGTDSSDLLAALESDGKVEFSVDVSLTDSDGTEVATVTVDWHVRRN